jgi:hypothetical protein
VKRRLWLLGILVGIAGLGVAGVVYASVPRSADAAIERFYSATDVAEGQLMNPLLLGGRKVVPRLIEEVKNKTMQRRRYAIAALGHLGDPSAIPVLMAIVNDSTELDYFRCDALEAIARIDRERGREVAREYRNTDIGYMPSLTAEILSDAPMERKTFLTVILGDFYHLFARG